jgi:SAM-dependent methyltransferase
MKEIFDEDYFENGIVTGKSCYVNYHWMPELTIKMANKMIKHLGLKEGDRVLDFGCAKGFLVRALRILSINAFGCDISRYAIGKADPEVKHACKLMKNGTTIPFGHKFDWIVSKDVLEHIKEKDIDVFLEKAREVADRMFHVIPLADKQGNLIVPEYELDKTHVLKKDFEWWMSKFQSLGWEPVLSTFEVDGIKDNWTSKYEKGNGFFVLEKR